MKLFTRYNRINLLSTVIIFLLASVAYFFLLRFILIDEVDDNLKIEQNEIQSYVSKYHRLPEAIQVKDQQIYYTEVKTSLAKGEFSTVKQHNPENNEADYFRRLFFTVHVDGKVYQAAVVKSLEGTDELIRSIILITVSTILLILLASIFINRIVLGRLWQPFYHTLEAIRKFQLGSKERLILPSSNIDEFTFMNNTLEQSMHKAEQDYLLLKEFTANASHELQTPLAIIRSKMDLLIQDENLSESQSMAVQSAYDSIQKLARLNQSLLLLTKIENRQFDELAVVDLKEKIEYKRAQFQELWQNKHLSVCATLENVTVSMNNELADVLLNNLLSNATKHNIEGGNININLVDNQLVISNSGAVKPLDRLQLFTRFYKAAPSNDNNGLGLSIAKQICEVSGFFIHYSFTNSTHVFRVQF